MIHAQLTEILIRPPGHPPSQCGGTLHRVDGAGKAIPDQTPATIDAALPDEGAFGEVSEIRLYRCSHCRQTLVVATRPDGDGKAHYLRNAWQKPQAELAATA